jgi:rare lipoprotein A
MNRVILGICVLSGCAQPPPPANLGPPKFVVGDPYQAGGEWFYPRNFNQYDQTGLSTVIGDGQNPVTADNEAYDPDARAAASPVLPLPAIVTITNLVNGYATEVRVNDRGPGIPGRLIAVTPRVASLLGYPSGGVVEVEVALDTQKTAALDGALGEGPKLTAAPVAGVQAEALGPPGSSQAAGPTQDLSPADQSGPAAAAVPLSGAVTVYPPSPGPLYVQIPGFGREADAFTTMEQQLYGIPAEIVPTFDGARTLYAVNAGPYHSVADADAALQEILQRGVTDPDIIVR